MSEPFDYRSLSHRLIGRIYACKEDWPNAAAALRTALELSPDYAEAHYEYAQYCVQAGDRRQWTDALRRAILAKAPYWNMAWAERNFAPVRKDMSILLKTISSSARKSALDAIAHAEWALQGAEQGISQLPAPARLSGASHNTYSNASQKLADARNNSTASSYPKLLKAAAQATESMRLAEQARSQAFAENNQLAAQRNQLTAQHAEKLKQACLGLLGWIVPTLALPFFAWLLFGLVGFVIRLIAHASQPGKSVDVDAGLRAFGCEGVIAFVLVFGACVLQAAMEFKRTMDGR